MQQLVIYIEKTQWTLMRTVTNKVSEIQLRLVCVCVNQNFRPFFWFPPAAQRTAADPEASTPPPPTRKKKRKRCCGYQKVWSWSFQKNIKFSTICSPHLTRWKSAEEGHDVFHVHLVCVAPNSERTSGWVTVPRASSGTWWRTAAARLGAAGTAGSLWWCRWPPPGWSGFRTESGRRSRSPTSPHLRTDAPSCQTCERRATTTNTFWLYLL